MTTVEQIGQNVIMSERRLFLPQESADLTVEIKNSDFKFRFINIFVRPNFNLEEVDVDRITVKRRGDVDDTRLLQNGPINIQQFGNNAALANGPNLLEDLDLLERDTDVVVSITNRDLIQGFEVTVALIGAFAEKTTRPARRREIIPQDGRRQEVVPQTGPLDGRRY